MRGTSWAAHHCRADAGAARARSGAHPYAAARPDGVPANAWIPLTADAGFVVTGNDPQMSSPGPASSVRGYLMARRGSKWVRLDPEAVAHLIPMN
jgi:hypothetical protein